MMDDSSLFVFEHFWRDSPVWYWLAAGLGLLVLEVLFGVGSMILFFPLGIGAIITGLTMLYYPNLPMETGVIVMGSSAVGLTLITRFLLPKRAPSSGTKLNRESYELIGQTTILKEPIMRGRGRVTLRGTVWTAIGADLPAGTEVTVVSQQGNALVVRRTTQENPPRDPAA